MRHRCDRALDPRARISGAAHFIVLAARFCSERDDINDVAWAPVYADPASLDRELARLETALAERR